jgi:energy-coupling factor transport system ATP-binding protein
VAIAGILAMNGSTLILDEPTGGLDPQGEEDFMNLFKTLHDQENKRIIMISHNMDQVLRLADEVIVMKDGKVVKHGTPFAVFSNQKLIDEMGLEPPKIYSLLYRLKEAGIDLTNQEIRNLDDFASAFVKYKKTAQAAKKRQQNAKKGTVKKTVTTSVKKTKKKEG